MNNPRPITEMALIKDADMIQDIRDAEVSAAVSRILKYEQEKDVMRQKYKALANRLGTTPTDAWQINGQDSILILNALLRMERE